MRALGRCAKAMETLAKIKRNSYERTRTLLSLAVGLALASPSVYAAGFSCPADSALTPIPVIQGSGDKSPLIPADKFESPQSVMVKAVVSGLGESLNKGFYLLDVQGDGNPRPRTASSSS